LTEKEITSWKNEIINQILSNAIKVTYVNTPYQLSFPITS